MDLAIKLLKFFKHTLQDIEATFGGDSNTLKQANDFGRRGGPSSGLELLLVLGMLGANLVLVSAKEDLETTDKVLLNERALALSVLRE
ncbi:hypothetical protein DPSP01_012762 [Paraphaeosphaeria sporulosa]